MTCFAFLTHILFAFGLFLLSCLICKLMIKHFRIIDFPNERSSHKKPTPKSGGIVVVVTFVCGIIAIYFFGDTTLIKADYSIGFVLGALIVAGISFYDDLKTQSFLFKLFGQIIATIIVLYSGVVLNQISLPFIGVFKLGVWGYVLTSLWIIGLTNAYNFMDGLNGIAAGTAVIAGTFFCFISFSNGSIFVYIICYTLISGSLGFMVFNFPKAKLFMGDVGSAFLGFVFSTLAIISAQYDHSHTSFLIIPLLFFNFIYDTFFTFMRRLINKENVFSAHRKHLYQLFNQLGCNHVKVSCFHFGVCIIQGFAACLLMKIIGSERLFVFIPFLIFQIIYSYIIISKSKKAGLL